MTLYLKYRPQTLDELDLMSVRDTLKKTLNASKIPHAFLFSGPKGTGKTSAARILAKVINCGNPPAIGVPCNKCSQCLSITKGENLDVIEIDAASHRGIDDVRALREAVKLSPAKAKKKVYIIDEAHMLTTEASNALLKTLEEPPSHVVFILATTNSEKLIDTIKSRTAVISFRKANESEIARSLERVAKGEKLGIEKDAFHLIAGAADGSFRDAIKILEQLEAEKKYKKEDIQEFLFNSKSFDAEHFLKLLAQKKAKSAIIEIEVALDKGASAKTLAFTIIERLREALLAEIGIKGRKLDFFDKYDLVSLLKIFSEFSSQISVSFIEQVPLEIAVIEWCDKEIKNEKLKMKNNQMGKTEDLQPKDTAGAEKKTIMEASGNGHADGFSDEVWVKILAQIRPKNASTEALLRAAKPLEFDGRNLKLAVYYKFHKEKLEANPHRLILEEAASSITGSSVRVYCSLTNPPVKSGNNGEVILTEPENGISQQNSALTQDSDEDIISAAKEIFGS